MSAFTTANGTAPGAHASPSPSATNSLPSQLYPAVEYAPIYGDLAEHLLAGWAQADFSDSQLHVQYADGSTGVFHVHALIVSQSPLIKSMLLSAFTTSPRPVLLLSILDPLINSSSLGLCLASLYSPSVLSHLSSATSPSVLATASFLGLERLATIAFEQCESSVLSARTADEVDFWVSFCEREKGPAFPSSSATTTPLIPGSPAATGPGGPTPPASVNGKSSSLSGGYESRLRTLLLDRIVRLPKELGAFEPATAAQTQPQLIDVLKRLPFEMFKTLVEDTRFEAPSDMDRFNFAKKAIAARKSQFLATASAPGALPPTDFEETVVLQFGQAGPGATAVNVLRKQRRPQLWKIGPGN
ncbi:hypothetical protein JCM11641_008458 [Rhodosporidiobolus odoratus]